MCWDWCQRVRDRDIRPHSLGSRFHFCSEEEEMVDLLFPRSWGAKGRNVVGGSKEVREAVRERILGAGPGHLLSLSNMHPLVCRSHNSHRYWFRKPHRYGSRCWLQNK